MSVASTPRPDVASKTAARVAVAAAFLFGAAMFLTVASVDVPRHATDAELLQWWQQESNRRAGVISSIFALCAAALFALLMSHVHHLEATRQSPTWRAFARTMASAFTAAMLVAAATRSTIAHQVDFLDQPLPGVDTLRYATAFNYQVVGLTAMSALALTIVATSFLALRTGAYSRWAAWVGLACGALMLAAVGAGYGIFTVPVAILWSVTLGVALRPSAHREG